MLKFDEQRKTRIWYVFLNSLCHYHCANILKTGFLHRPVSKSDLHDLHFHHAVADLCKETEKTVDGWVAEIVVCLLYTSRCV